jgi:hypothetical protein
MSGGSVEMMEGVELGSFPRDVSKRRRVAIDFRVVIDNHSDLFETHCHKLFVMLYL